MAATIRQVAERAGVSVATVSRVLNGSDRVLAITRKRVLEAMEALQYLPNETARILSTGKTNVIGVLLPDLHGEFYAKVSQGIERMARTEGYHLLVSSSHSDEAEAGTMIRTMLGRVDGLIVMWPRLEAASLTALVPPDLPIVLLNAAADGAVPTVRFDNQTGAAAMTRHLASHGHRRIAFLKGPAGNYDAEERLAGYRDALRELDLPADPALELDGNFLRESGYRAVEALLALEPRPTALFAANDSMAIGALLGLRERGVRVPDDLALAGFDDIPPAQYLIPQLSTVRSPMQDLGEHAMHTLLALLGGDDPEPITTLPTRLMLRESCGCPPVPAHLSLE
ncbi:hypothetical protein AWN76_006400 [Rhodothermaceae bacterium RA]|nr:hypothetical protein AWN76_006400 [Rhodothermaceae bacterium RA]